MTLIMTLIISTIEVKPILDEFEHLFRLRSERGVQE